MSRVSILGLLLFLNLPVWLGQVWPAGAPPFARSVNIAFLSATLLFFGVELRRAVRARRR